MYPIMIDLSYRSILVIGGGVIATRKIQGIVEAGGYPMVIAPQLTNELQLLLEANKIQYQPRIFQTGDTKGYEMIFICTKHPEVNQCILSEVSPNQLVNDTTKHENSNFYNMGVIRDTDYLVATSTYGKNPSLSKRLARFIKKSLINFD